MPRKATTLPAKLSPPQLQHAVPRERLFAWLDRHRSGAAIWLGSPPGSGKTMLAASYLQARSVRGIWYRLDADDNDLGQFFATIGQAVDRLGPKVKRPVFCAEDLNRPRSYSRSWFRAVFASLPRPLVIDRSDMPSHFRATWLQVPIYERYVGGDAALALRQLEQLCADAEPGSRSILEANLGSLRALSYLRAGHADDAAQALRPAWQLAADVRYYQLLAPMRAELAELAAFALERGIATTFARELIARRRLRPASRAMSQWPWPLRIFTLGRFAVHVDGKPLKFEGKVPKKPLALLKALIAFGADQVPVHVVTDALWADDEADAAHDAFNVALHRLRKLIPHGAELIQLQDGRLSLDLGACWVDSWAFEQLVADGSAAQSGGALSSAPLQQALELYQGLFLADDVSEPWSASTRERLRSKFNRTVVVHGRALSAAGREEEAMECFRRGLDTDDLAEDFYQGLMRSALRLQRPAEGIAAYQRLQRVLAMVLGVAPSAETEALLRQLLN